MVTKTGKAAGPGTTAAMRAAEMMVQMARGKARAAAEQVKRMRKKVKAAKKDLKQVKKVARQAKKSLKAAQATFEIAKTNVESKETRETQATAVPKRARRKRSVLKKAPVVGIALPPATGSQPADPEGAMSTVPGPNEARP